jgi:16S rRNA G527 N7-methylase RsmG
MTLKWNFSYLLYAPTEEPDYEADWLLDIRLYSRSFQADHASIIRLAGAGQPAAPRVSCRSSQVL